MIALSFGFFTASSTRGPARRDSKLPTAFSRNPNDARMAMQLLSDNEPSYYIIAENRTSIHGDGQRTNFLKAFGPKI
jgi:hypothetical protein